MDAELQRRIAQLIDKAHCGDFGETVQRDAAARAQGPLGGMATCLRAVRDFYDNPARTEEPAVARMTDQFCQLFIVVYREAKRVDASVATALLHSFIYDYSGVPGSCLYPQVEALLVAAHAWKAARGSPLLAWQQSVKLVQAYNEFLNALLGYYLVAWRCGLGKRFSTNVFRNAYGAKLKEFSELTHGDDGPFYLIFRLVNVPLRNAIAHEDVWLDTDTSKVRYVDGKEQRVPYELDLMQFLSSAMVGSYLGPTYLAAIAALLVLEEGSAAEVAHLPAHLIKTFRFRKE